MRALISRLFRIAAGAFIGAVLLCGLHSPGHAQGAVQAVGPYTMGHPACWYSQAGGYQSNYLGDCGITTNTPNGFASQLLVTNGTGPGLCVSNGPTAGTTGPYNQLCLGVSSSQATISLTANAGAPVIPCDFVVNGVTTACGGGGSQTAGLLQVGTVAGLEGASVLNTAVLRTGYYVAGDSPSAVYYPLTGACSNEDGGAQFPTTTPGTCWQIQPQTVWDVRLWGAQEDTLRVNTTVTTTATSCSVTVAGTTFTVADQGKYITITDAISGSPNGPSYAGTITAASSGPVITVSPCVGFSTNQAQYATWGHDTSAAWNAMISYVGNLGNMRTPGKPQVSGGGLSAGLVSPVFVNANLQPTNVQFVVLGSANFPLPASGALEIVTSTTPTGLNGTLSAASYFNVDLSWLPVQGIYATANGSIWWDQGRVQNWMGSSPITTPLTGVSTNQEASLTGSISGCTGTNPYVCTLTVSSVTGVIQPNQTLVGAGIPNGTYVSDYGAPRYPGFNSGAAQYVVQSLSDPTVTSESMVTLGLDITVTGGSPADSGKVSRGNTCISDRTVIVAFSGGKETLNKPPLCAISSGTATLYTDSNGIYLASSAGMHFRTFQVSQTDFFTIPGNEYGAAIYDDSKGGSEFFEDTFSFGVVPIILGPDAKGNSFITNFITQNFSGGSQLEFDPASVLMVDGSTNNKFVDLTAPSLVEYFDVAGAGAPEFSVQNPNPFINTGTAFYAPRNNIWAYTEMVNTQTENISVQPFGIFFPQTATGNFIYTVGNGGSWLQYTTQQTAQIASSQNVMITDNGAEPIVMPQGVSLASSVLTSFKTPRVALTASYSFMELDSGTTFTNSGSIPITLTIPNNINSENPSTEVWKVGITNGSGNAITVVPGSGTTLYQSGSSTSTVTLTENVPYELSCPFNGGGTSAVCYLK